MRACLRVVQCFPRRSAQHILAINAAYVGRADSHLQARGVRPSRARVSSVVDPSSCKRDLEKWMRRGVSCAWARVRCRHSCCRGCSGDGCSLRRRRRRPRWSIAPACTLPRSEIGTRNMYIRIFVCVHIFRCLPGAWGRAGRSGRAPGPQTRAPNGERNSWRYDVLCCSGAALFCAPTRPPHHV